MLTDRADPVTCLAMSRTCLEKRALRPLLLALLATVAAAKSDSTAAAPAGTPASASVQADSSAATDYFVIESRHQVFADFRQVDTVRMNQPFSIGEGEEMGSVFIFNPHFLITDSGKVMQLSDTLYNPAVRVRVSLGDSVLQESWAFYYSSAPHFRRNHMFGFRLLDFHVSDRFVKVQGPAPAAPPHPADSTKKSH